MTCRTTGAPMRGVMTLMGMRLPSRGKALSRRPRESGAAARRQGRPDRQREGRLGGYMPTVDNPPLTPNESYAPPRRAGSEGLRPVSMNTGMQPRQIGPRPTGRPLKRHPHRLMDTDNPRMQNTFRNAGGVDRFIHSNENVRAILDRLAPTGTLPRLMFACGEEDRPLYDEYLKFQDHCKKIGLEAHWLSRPGFGHEWRFWDLAIQEALAFFGL